MNHMQPVRKGMIAQPDLVLPGMIPVAGHPVGYGGVRWAYQKKKRSQCKGYDDAVKEYERKYAKHRNNGCSKASFFGLRKARCYDTAREMKAAEAKGKAAWKACQAYSKGEAQGHTQLDTSGGYSITASTGESALIDPVTGLPMDPSMAAFQSGEEESGGNGLLWAGVGVLLVATGGLIVYKRRQKGKKGKGK